MLGACKPGSRACMDSTTGREGVDRGDEEDGGVQRRRRRRRKRRRRKRRRRCPHSRRDGQTRKDRATEMSN